MLALTHPSERPTASRGINAFRPSDECVSDAVLIKAVAAGDRQAMHLLYTRYNLAVYRFILRLIHNPSVAEDVVSNVFLDVWQRAGSFRGKCTLSTWLLAIARNKALSTFRRRSPSDLDQAGWEMIEDPAESPESLTENENRSTILKMCLGQLSAAHREVIDLVYYHQKTVDESAEIMGIPCNTAKTRMFYARRNLRALPESAGVQSQF